MENKDCLNELAKFLLLACEKEQKVKCSANMFDFLETRVLKVDFIGKQDIELILSNLLAELKNRLKISIFLWRKSCASR